MTLIKERAVEFIKNIPDNKMIHVIAILENIEALTADVQNDRTSVKSMAALKRLEKYKKSLPSDFDYKKELDEVREVRYGSIN